MMIDLKKVLSEVSEIEEILQKSTPAHVLKKIKEGKARFAILTPDDPKHPGSMTHEQMRNELNELQRKGLISGFFPTKGMYDSPNFSENSYLVENPKDFSHILDMGKRAGQDAVLLSHKGHNQMAYTNGEHEGMANEGTGHGFSDKFAPFSTKIKPRSATNPTYVQAETNYGGEYKPITMDKSQDEMGMQKNLTPNLNFSQFVPIMPMRSEHSNLQRLRRKLHVKRKADSTIS